MYTARKAFVHISFAYWIVCMIAAPSAFAADLGGRWWLECRLVSISADRKVICRDGVCRELEVSGQDWGGTDDFCHDGCNGWAVHSNGKIEGNMKKRRWECGYSEQDPNEECDFQLTGTISDDNRVALTFNILGVSCFSYGPEATHYYSYTGIIGSLDGVYDPINNIITGTFQHYQERCYSESSYHEPNRFGYQHHSTEVTNIVSSGTFTIYIFVPVILIPGWAHNEHVWGMFKSFIWKDFSTKAPVHSHPWTCPPYEEVELPEYAYPDTNAEITANQIELIRERNDWPGKINLVAHSQGGLDARAYLRNLGEKAKDQVHSLTMIATPNHGTNGATLRDWYYRITFRPEKCTPWLTPEGVEEFNQRTPLVEGVKYYTVAGSLKHGLFSWRKDRIGSFLVKGEDDGVVPVQSVLIEDSKVEHLGTFPYSHSQLVAEEDVYRAVVSKIDPPYSEEPNSLAFIAVEDGEILSEVSISRSVTVDDVNEVAFVLISATPLDLALQSPNGQDITPQSLSANISHDSGDWLDLQVQAYVVHKPVPGIWKVDVTGGTESDHFMLIVSAENTFVLDGTTDSYLINLGENVTLKAKLSNNRAVREMEAEIVAPDGLREVVTLYDDGIHGDNSPCDGLYGNSFTPFLEGEYIMLFSADGVMGTREFSRVDLKSIFVAAPRADSF